METALAVSKIHYYISLLSTTLFIVATRNQDQVLTYVVVTFAMVKEKMVQSCSSLMSRKGHVLLSQKQK
jgi:hypothetical protein